ncbi:unnamed protein product [Chironomus riparius]|uniref:Uncharacterized protein n=1 Tax=Chironomus riparius TaxID=315576 RepID=A0A9N9RL40_9DIPT|nr:unnamed protein product [Chironomus riparius]
MGCCCSTHKIPLQSQKNYNGNSQEIKCEASSKRQYYEVTHEFKIDNQRSR